VLLVAGVAILGAALGAALTVAARSMLGFYIPIVPGYLAASAIVRVHRSDAIWVGLVGGLCGFVGGLFAEAFVYVNPGVWHYVSHFYENATTMDWLFRVINAGVGFWFARSATTSIEVQSASSTTPQVATFGGAAYEIRRLAELAAEGILSEDELTRAKEHFLGKPKSKQDEAVRLLQDLHQLVKQGVLSEGEFNMKKWDILSKKDIS